MLVGQLASITPRHQTQHLRLAAAGIQDARQNLDRGRFARAIRADKGQQLARFQAEGNAFDGIDLLQIGPDDGAQTAAQANLLALYGKGLGEGMHVDDRHSWKYK